MGFVFLGAKIEESGSCKGVILRRLALCRATMTGLNKIWKDKNITIITTKCRLVIVGMPSKCIRFPSIAAWL